jgi:glycosyltransferase involved in cell wall biosynthesis/pyruvate-formate lyase-activating enzyme
MFNKILGYCGNFKGDLVIYGVSAYMGRSLRIFEANGIKPVCLTDSDRNKWGYKYSGIECERPIDAVKKYPKAYFYVASLYHTPAIMGYLTAELKIPQDRILNFEPIEFRIGCLSVEMNIVVLGTENNNFGRHSHLQFCHNDFGRNSSPFVDFDGDYNKLVSGFIEKRESIINNDYKDCKGCPELKRSWFYKERKVRYVSYSEHGGCNLNCIYCKVTAKRKPAIYENDINLKALMDVAGEYLSNDYVTVFDAGEIAVDPERDELYNEAELSADYILTNASIYDERIKNILATGKTALNISIDAGTASTYAHVKGVDCWGKMVRNLKKYAESGNREHIHLKYLFIPEINDNIEDIDGFVELVKEIGAGVVIISHDLRFKELPDSVYHCAKYLIRQLTNSNIVFTIYSNLIKSRTYPDQSRKAKKAFVFTCAYNAEKTIRRTIKSVLGQTFQDFDYFILNNGSTDNTADIIEEYASVDNRIYPIQVNMNDLRNNRTFFNLICTNTRSKYAARIDADDSMDKDFLETMIKYADENDLDITACGYRKIDGETNKLISVKQAEENFVIAGDKYRDEFMRYRGYTIYLWAKLYRIDFYANIIKFSNSDITQCWDSTTMMKIISATKRFGVVGKSMMNYYIYENSLSNKLSVGIYDTYMDEFFLTLEFLTSRGDLSPKNENFLHCIYLSIIDELIERIIVNTAISGDEKEQIISDTLNHEYSKQVFSYIADEGFHKLAERKRWLESLKNKTNELSEKYPQLSELEPIIDNLMSTIPN